MHGSAKTKKAWWIGFDCAHHNDANDYESVRQAFAGDEKIVDMANANEFFDSKFGIKGEIRTTNFCEAECRSIVEQIVEGSDA